VTSLFNTEDTFNPSYDFVRGRVSRLVKVNNTITDIFIKRTL
jgi:hypothetical protein